MTAVVVAHRGTRWLAGLRAALAAQTVPPDLVVGTDTSGGDDGDPGSDSGLPLRAWLGDRHVAHLPAGTGFGAAVAAALTMADRDSDWVWLLHDDCAPAPDALAALLAEARREPSTGVVGPKVRGLGQRRLLLEIGVTIGRSGRRETGLERREQDQGQHDGTRTVLAVGSAGMLVRRDVWDELGGFDDRLPLLRDDLDFGWRATLAGYRVAVTTDAVVYHAEASARRRRPVHAAGGRPHRLDRRHAIYVLLANLPLYRVPGSALRLLLASLVRALGLFAGKRPGHAADELLAAAAVLGRPDRLVRARLSRRRTRRRPARAAAPLLAPRGAAVRHALDGLLAFLGDRAGDALGGRHRAGPAGTETGPTSPDADALPPSGTGPLRRVLGRPCVLAGSALLLLALVAVRGLLGEGRLMGGALLPAPAGAADLWARYLAAWHPVGLGSDAGAPPYLAVLALLAGLLLGSAERAVDVLLLGAVPLAGLTAYLALRRLTRARMLRVWGALAYALLPPLLAAVATGRLGTAATAVLLPLVALTAGRALAPAGGAGAWRAAWGTGLLLTVVAAFVPLLWAVGALTVVGAAALRQRARGPALRRAAAAALVPPLLLLPWLSGVTDRPQLLLGEPGLAGPGLSVPDLGGLDLLLLHPGGPGAPPLPIGAGLLAAALAALLRADRRRLILGAWAVALVGLGGAFALARSTVSAPTLAAPVAAWPGPLLLLAGAGMVAAAVVGADGARARVAGASFGWRQPAALVVLVLAGLAPGVTAGWWAVTGAGDPLVRRDPRLLPAFVAAEGATPARPRTLLLRERPDGSLRYAVLRSDGPRTGDADLAGPRPRGLDAAVADLASGRGGDAAGRLVPYGVRFVLLDRPVDRRLVRAIESVPGIVPVSRQEGSVLWRVAYRTARVRLLPPGAPVVGPDGGPPPATVVPAGQVEAHADLPTGAAGRLLVVADLRDDGWRATLDGRALRARRYDGWAQAFVLPAGGGRLSLTHDPGSRPALLRTQLALVLVVLVAALPQVGAPAAEPEGADLPEPVPDEAAP